MGGPGEGIYIAIILIVPVGLASVVSTILLGFLFNKFNITRRFDRIFLGASLPIMGYLIYLLAHVLIFQDLVLAIRDTWFIMIIISVTIILNAVTIRTKVES